MIIGFSRIILSGESEKYQRLPLPHYHHWGALEQGPVTPNCSTGLVVLGSFQVWLCVTVWFWSGCSCKKRGFLSVNLLWINKGKKKTPLISTTALIFLRRRKRTNHALRPVAQRTPVFHTWHFPKWTDGRKKRGRVGGGKVGPVLCQFEPPPSTPLLHHVRPSLKSGYRLNGRKHLLKVIFDIYGVHLTGTFFLKTFYWQTTDSSNYFTVW